MNNQTFTSANTSLNQVARLFKTKTFESILSSTNSSILDYGGGKYNLATNYIKDTFNRDLIVYDKFNRTPEHNKQALSNTYEIVACNNVLNVIDNLDTYYSILNDCYNLATKYVLITIYNGNGSNIGKQSKADCYQRNETIKVHFDRIKALNVMLKMT